LISGSQFRGPDKQIGWVIFVTEMLLPDEFLNSYSDRARHLIETALDLFYRNGFHATGIDTVLAKAGVSKMTLYNHFGSKEELILAVLRLRDLRWRQWFISTVESASDKPEERLLATFDALNEWVNSRKFYGCMFINASAEFPNRTNPIHIAAADHKRLVYEYLLSLSKAVRKKDSQRLARQIFLLNEGVIIDAHVSSNKDSSAEAKQAAVKLLKS